MRVEITTEALATIRAAAAADPMREVCGLLFGAPGLIARAEPAANVATRPADRFEIDPRALFAALREERGGGERLVGYYHSHPGGDPTPSRTDAEQAAADGRLWLIIGGDTVAAWRAGPDGERHRRFDRVELAVSAVAG